MYKLLGFWMAGCVVYILCDWLERSNTLVLVLLHSFNPLTPVPPVTGRDEPWHFFHFWCHGFWPKLTSSILNFCRRKRSFQWCPDQSDKPNGALDMQKNAQKVEWETLSKISCLYTCLLHAKICPSQWHFLRSFLTVSKPSRRVITAAKPEEKEKKERRKKNSKNWKAQRRRSLSPQNFHFCACLSHNALKRYAGDKKGKLLCCKRIFHRSKAKSANIQPKNHQNVQKTHFLQKGVNGLKITVFSIVMSHVYHSLSFTVSCWDVWDLSL